ncbi:MAG: amino acid permease [Propionibacteriaceae bacterium]
MSSPAELPPIDTTDGEGSLQRSLSNRHIQLIAIGGAIGTGLFMGSGKTISVAGPSILLVYLIIGIFLFFMMRAMGELLLHNLNYKSFQDFAGEFLGPWAAFFTGWTYWLSWVVTGMADIIAVTGYWQYWTHDKTWAIVLSVATFVLILILNLLTVKLFGELEFWFALIKIIAIVSLIVLGLVLAVIAFQPKGADYHSTVANVWNYGGFFPHGLDGFLAGFQIAIFAYVGIELIGTTAAETKDPTKTLPKAINQVPVRVLIFYIGALLAIMTVTPWDKLDPSVSPFVNLFGLVGFAAAASVMNFVVLTSASSSANSGVYSTSRMLYGLSHKGMAAKPFGKLTKQGVPYLGLVLTIILILSSLLLAASESIMAAFTVVTTVSAVLFLFLWSMIMVSYLVYRKKRPEAHGKSVYPFKGGVVLSYLTLAFFAFCIYVLTREDDTRNALLVAPIWFAILGVGYMLCRKHIHEDDTHTQALGHK